MLLEEDFRFFKINYMQKYHYILRKTSSASDSGVDTSLAKVFIHCAPSANVQILNEIHPQITSLRLFSFIFM